MLAPSVPFKPSNQKKKNSSINTKRYGRGFSIYHLLSSFSLYVPLCFYNLFTNKHLKFLLMASYSFRFQILCTLLLLFFILDLQVEYVDARHLRKNLGRDCSKHRQNAMSNAAHGGVDDNGSNTSGVNKKKTRRVEYEVDDFRPTSPGHSPGVGHSINN